jgi:hypothetical protein
MNQDEDEMWIVAIGNDGGIKWAQAIMTAKDVSLSVLQDGVGGYIEPVSVENGRLPVPSGKGDGEAWVGEIVECYVNEEGVIMGLEENVVASFACYGEDAFQENGPKLFGDVVFIVKKTDEVVRAEEWLLRAATALGLDAAEAEDEINHHIRRKLQERHRKATGIVWAEYEDDEE